MGHHSCLQSDRFAVKRRRSRVLARFDVSMISCLDLAQIWVTIVFLVKKNIGIMSMSKK